MKFIIFGAPGSGKGTYASRIAPKLGIVHIATGDLLRDLVKQDTPEAKKIKDLMAVGAVRELNDVVIDLLKKELAKPEAQNGFILDGFPRNIEQVEELDKITQIDAILTIQANHEIMIEKITARRTCKECGEIYNIADINRDVDGVHYTMPPMFPKVEGKCDKCGGELVQREDAKPEVVEERFKVYETQSKPVLDYYQGKIPFIEIVANDAPDTVTERTMEKIHAAGLDK